MNSSCKLQCVKCGLKFLTLSETVLHQKCHSSDKNFKFTCVWSECGLQFLTYNALNLHVTYTHKDVLHVPQVAETISVRCSVPSCEVTFPSSNLLCKHLMKVHLQEQGTPIQCPFKEECKSEHFFPLPSFKVHLSQKHSEWAGIWTKQISTTSLASEVSPDDVEIPDNVGFGDAATHDDDDYDVRGISDSIPTALSHSEKLHQKKDEFYRCLSMLYMKLEAQHFIPVSTIDVIAQGIAQLSEINMSIMRESIVHELQELEVSEDVLRRKTMKILSSDCLFDAHHKDTIGPTFTTNSLRKTYYRSHFQYIKPKEINLSKDTDDPHCIYYVSIKKSLKLILECPEIEREVEASFSRKSQEGIIQDYKDGSLHKERMKNSSEKTIDLLIFQDAFTPTKDLSSVSNVYQILGVYMTIGNLRPHLRSKLDFMRLIMLIPHWKQIFSRYKLSCFNKVVQALKSLEVQGISFKGEQIKVKLRFLIGDNKGQHEIGGFIQSFSSEYFCRFCTMTKTDIIKEPWKVGEFRTKESYEQASLSVPADRKTFEGVSGPEWQCPFNVLEDFHCCDPGLASCIGHDVFEGVVNYDLSLILAHLILEENWLTYELLNRKIKKFLYKGQDSGNKPASVRFDQDAKRGKQKKSGEEMKRKQKEKNLGGHAVQNWTLLRLLPFILDEDSVPDPDNEYWQLYILLKKVVEYVTAPSYLQSQISELRDLLNQYSKRRQELLGNGKPKHHFLNHFPALIEQMGPLLHLMTLRFESYHQFFKHTIENYVNVGASCLKKYCLHLSYLSAGSSSTAGIVISDHGIKVSAKRITNPSWEFDLAVQNKGVSDQALVMTQLVQNGVKFKAGEWLLLGHQSEHEILSAQITSILLHAQEVYLVLEQHTAHEREEFGLYVVDSESKGLICLSTQELKYPIAQSMYEWGDFDLCFSLKHTLLPL